MDPEESEAPKALTKNPLGATGDIVAANVDRLRNEQNLTFAALAERLIDIQRPIPTLGLRKIVAKTRRVDADDLVALAVALGVSVPTLMMPAHVDESTRVSITGSTSPVTARSAWYWLAGHDPLPSMMTPEWGLQKFRAFAWPTFVEADHDRDMLRQTDLELRAQGVQNLGDD
ncbi:hypothetical protein EV580_3141 [Mycobacterium sp. BK086]|uniref:helix-turn-helix domain-containing protein n=1 Tax=Mycobacterium sp. BK086 TaxID=2512165 RepID=UPI00105E7E76|nr:helix-turn-helix transcriptional regulator [Mycobacterium sp. BK086]TDO15001.1 hypothetical protein EV580_3141 [Mycobacterium sp. BK086]